MALRSIGLAELVSRTLIWQCALSCFIFNSAFVPNLTCTTLIEGLPVIPAEAILSFLFFPGDIQPTGAKAS
jgi:hypothetical protein